VIKSYIFVFIGFFVFGGCVTTGPSAPEIPQHSVSSTSDTDDSARGRARIHTDLAANYLEIRNLAVALEEVGIAQRADPTYSPAFNVAGLIYIEMQDDRNAEESFRHALRLAPRDSDANNNYGTFLCQRKREADGIKHFMLAVNDPLYRYPDRSYVNAGVCARRAGDVTSAQKYFLSALKIQPNEIQALYQLADISYAAGRYNEARPFLARLLPVASGSPEILWLMLRNERRLGDGNSLDSLAHQLRTNFPNSKEAGLLAAGKFD
jgi:type IV pilus assembly protein PilF